MLKQVRNHADFERKGAEKMLNAKIADIVKRLKKVREENGLSYQRIFDLVQESGNYVSLSTIRRVFEDGSESYGWQYENTLKPIAAAVLGAYSPPDEAAEDVAETMQAIIDYKSMRIRELENQLARMEESYKRRLDFVKNQIVLKDARIDRRDDMIEKLLDAVLQQYKGGLKHVHNSKPETGRNPDIPPKKPHR